MAKQKAVMSPASAGADETGATGEAGADASADGAGAIEQGVDLGAGQDLAEDAPAVMPGEDSGAAGDFSWPVTVFLRNHSHAALHDPVSGVFIEAGGSRELTLRDEEHAQALTTSITAEAKLRGHAEGSIVFDGLKAANE